MGIKASVNRRILVSYQDVASYLLKGYIIISYGSDGVVMGTAR